MAAPACLEPFDFFLSELSNRDDSAILKFHFSFFKIFVSYEHKLFYKEPFYKQLSLKNVTY